MNFSLQNSVYSTTLQRKLQNLLVIMLNYCDCGLIGLGIFGQVQDHLFYVRNRTDLGKETR
jgi:hypothetical protein